MAKSTERASRDLFEQSKQIWFPDLAETLNEEKRLYSKYGADFSSLTAVLRFFCRELTRSQFTAYFLEQKPPQKMLSRHRKLYQCAQKLCISYQERAISDAEFDDQLLLAFRNRPTEDVFSPAFETWSEIAYLITLLEKKSQSLPVYFDGLSWGAYLKGIVTGRQYAEAYLTVDTGGYLAQLLSYGADSVKASLSEQYSTEVSVCIRLRTLCIDYKHGSLSPVEFGSRFLQLAREFCSDIDILESFQ